MNIKTNEIQFTINFLNSKQLVKISGKVNENVKDNILTFSAAAPADRMTSFSGSGLPFPNAQMAFDNSKNIGSIKISSDNTFSLEMYTPNSYYVGMTHKIPPTVYFKYNNGYKNKNISLKLFDGIPYRSLTYPEQRKDVAFYSSLWALPVRGQEEILRSSGYPSDVMIEYEKFWGLRPPV